MSVSTLTLTAFTSLKNDLTYAWNDRHLVSTDTGLGQETDLTKRALNSKEFVTRIDPESMVDLRAIYVARNDESLLKVAMMIIRGTIKAA